jgi:hypothetical protein
VPECVNDEKRSTVTVGPTDSTLMHAAPYYDEEGQYHLHDPNTLTTTYRCSRGHTWITRGMVPCPTCGDKWHTRRPVGGPQEGAS